MKKYIFLEGFVKIELNEQDVEGNVHTNVYSKKYSNYLLIMKSFIIASQKKLRQWSHMRMDNENCGFLRTYIHAT